jgi:microsomal dipeptidase-like Zn-dependent dipeptidase
MPAMILDLHAHYPMHLVPEERRSTLDVLVTGKGRARWRDRIRALLVGLASRFANYRSFEAGPRVTVEGLRSGDVGAILSVLYSFFDELDLDSPYGADPEAGYLNRLIRELEVVEKDIAEHHAGEATVAHSFAELQAALGAGTTALIHCVEGGFHLGPTPEAVEHGVAELARRGVAYTIPAHLIWRGVATNAPALPFLSDRMYRLLLPQPDVGLSELGRAAVRAMVRERVLIDLSHMSERALADTFALLDELDPEQGVPVLASHAAFRFGQQEYGVDEDSVRRIAARDGLVGLIMAQHQLNDGVRKGYTTTFEQSFEVICRHIDRLAEITGSHRHTGIGTDFDGFIKPTMGGLESMADMRTLEAALRDRYGPADAEAICSGNALRVLRAGWGGAGPGNRRQPGAQR